MLMSDAETVLRFRQSIALVPCVDQKSSFPFRHEHRSRSSGVRKKMCFQKPNFELNLLQLILFRRSIRRYHTNFFKFYLR